MDGIEAPCPLCGDAFNDDESYTAHLADAHGLVDDEGAESTTVEHALVVSGIAADRLLAAASAEEAAASKAEAAGEAAPEVHPSRIYDPHQDDSRLKPLVIGLAGLLLLGAIGIGALVIGSGGDDDPADLAAGGTTSTTAAGGGLGGTEPQPAVVIETTTTAATPVEAPAATEAPPATTTTVTVRPATPRPAPTTPPPPPTSPPPTSPPPTSPPPTSPPPTTAPPFAAPALSGARIDGCVRTGPEGTWSFSYVLAGGTGWAPAPGATALGGGRYAEQRTGKASQGFPSAAIQVVDVATGQGRSINLSPSLLGADCR